MTCSESGSRGSGEARLVIIEVTIPSYNPYFTIIIKYCKDYDHGPLQWFFSMLNHHQPVDNNGFKADTLAIETNMMMVNCGSYSWFNQVIRHQPGIRYQPAWLKIP